MTRNIFIITTILVLAGLMAFQCANQKPEQTKGGIEFFQGNWEAALAKSKLESKPIFLDISASWCGPCKQLKRNTFSNEAVGAYYNEHFINVAVDGERGEGRQLAKQLGIRGYPSLFVIDANSNVLTASAGYQNPKQFLEFGASGLNKFKP